MGHLDSQGLEEASRTCDRPRRRDRRWSLGLPLGLLVFAICGLVGPSVLEPVAARGLALLAVLAFVGAGLSNMVASSAIYEFRCPSCGGRFARSWWSRRPTDRCKHCGLDLPAEAREVYEIAREAPRAAGSHA